MLECPHNNSYLSSQPILQDALQYFYGLVVYFDIGYALLQQYFFNMNLNHRRNHHRQYEKVFDKRIRIFRD